MLNDTFELSGVIELTDEEFLAVSRAKSKVNEAMQPEIQVYIGTDENLDELFDETILLRPCGCELHFNESSFELFECKSHKLITHGFKQERNLYVRTEINKEGSFFRSR